VIGLLAWGCAPSRPPLHIYAMGERAEAGLLVYSVLESRWQAQIGEGGSARLPKERFLLLRVSVTNGGPNDVSVPQVTLVGPGVQSYTELSDGQGVIDFLGVLQRLKANETVYGWILFDAPRSDYQLRVTDDAFDPSEAKAALIQVPVRLESKSDFLPDVKPVR
jgi:hypothetical protein